MLWLTSSFTLHPPPSLSHKPVFWCIHVQHRHITSPLCLPCASEGCGRIGITVCPDVYELSRSPAHVSQRCRRLRLLRDMKGKQTEAYFFFVNLAIVYSSVRSRLTKQPSTTGVCAPLRTPAVIRNEHICSHVTDTCWNKSLGSLSRI